MGAEANDLRAAPRLSKTQSNAGAMQKCGDILPGLPAEIKEKLAGDSYWAAVDFVLSESGLIPH